MKIIDQAECISFGNKCISFHLHSKSIQTADYLQIAQFFLFNLIHDANVKLEGHHSDFKQVDFFLF